MAQKPKFDKNKKSFKKGMICPYKANFGQPLTQQL